MKMNQFDERLKKENPVKEVEYNENRNIERREVLFIKGDLVKIESDKLLVNDGDIKYEVFFESSYIDELKHYVGKNLKISVDGDNLKLIDIFEDNLMFEKFVEFFILFYTTDSVQRHDILQKFLLDIILYDKRYVINLMRIFFIKFKVKGFYRTILTTLKPMKNGILDEKTKSLYNHMAEEFDMI